MRYLLLIVLPILLACAKPDLYQEKIAPIYTMHIVCNDRIVVSATAMNGQLFGTYHDFNMNNWESFNQEAYLFNLLRGTVYQTRTNCD